MIVNLEFLSATLNQSKGAKVGERNKVGCFYLFNGHVYPGGH
jgi:hypothetical protein